MDCTQYVSSAFPERSGRSKVRREKGCRPDQTSQAVLFTPSLQHHLQTFILVWQFTPSPSSAHKFQAPSTSAPLPLNTYFRLAVHFLSFLLQHTSTRDHPPVLHLNNYSRLAVHFLSFLFSAHKY